MRPVLGIVAALLAGACSTERSHAVPEGMIVAGNLRYEATTLSGGPLVRGRMEIDVLPDSSIVGTWSAHWAPGADTTIQVGGQIGSGSLRGKQTESGSYIDLNPGYADNNVILLPVPAEGGFTGTWYWSSIAGPQTYGRFTALRD